MGIHEATALDSSIFADKVGSNYSVTDDEIKQLRALLTAPTVALDRLQQEIIRVSAELVKLREQHSTLSSKVDAHRALMSPMRRMPVDIIREIFLHCLPVEHNPIMSRHSSPMLLTQVCSSWRHIAHSTPLLWNTIHVAIPCKKHQLSPSYWRVPAAMTPSNDALGVAQKRASGISQWFTRSGECPLNIFVYDHLGGSMDSSWNPILTVLISFSHRWQTLHIQSSSKSLSRIVALSERDVPMLKSLSIQGPEMQSPGFQFQPETPDDSPGFRFLIDSGLLKAPQLQEISYRRLNENFLLFPLQWEQLTVISLTGYVWNPAGHISLSRLAEVLRRCPALTNGTFEVADLSGQPQSSPSAPLQPIIHTSLKHLTLQIGKTDLAALCQALNVPNLRGLDFFVNYPLSVDAALIGHLLPFLERTSATLESLTMDPSLFKKESLHKILRHTPRLKSLFLIPTNFPGYEIWTPRPRHSDLPDSALVFTVDDDLLTAFNDEVDPLTEHLESFECDVDCSLTDEALVSFIRAKRSLSIASGRRPLKKIAVTLHRRQTLPMVRVLKQYVNDGLVCHLAYLPAPTQSPYPASDGTDMRDVTYGRYQP